MERCFSLQHRVEQGRPSPTVLGGQLDIAEWSRVIKADEVFMNQPAAEPDSDLGSSLVDMEPPN